MPSIPLDPDKSFGKAPLRLADALNVVLSHLTPIEDQERVPLWHARGRILASDLVSPIDLPLYDCSAMDGFAVRTADLGRDGRAHLKIIGEAAAGHPFDGDLKRGQAVRIFTGASLPSGADRIVAQEICSIDQGRVRIVSDARGKDNWRRRGEDISASTRVLLGGHRLRSQDVALAGSLGIDQLDVRRKLRIGLFSTGDELCEPGQMRDRGQIWDANRLLLLGLLDTTLSDVKDYGIVRDDPTEVEGRLLAAARDCDLLITTGGMSVGREDHIRNIIGRRGVLDVWPVAIKPGRPVGFGDIDDCPILALPGNPTAAFIAFVAFGRPIVDALCGMVGPFTSPLHLPAGFSFEKPNGLRQYLLAGVASERFGMSTAIPWHKQSPAMLSPLTKAAGLIVLPEERERVRFGELVEFLPIETFIE